MDEITADEFKELLTGALGAAAAGVASMAAHGLVRSIVRADLSPLASFMVATTVGLGGGALLYRYSPNFAIGFAGSSVGLAVISLFVSSLAPMRGLEAGDDDLSESWDDGSVIDAVAA